MYFILYSMLILSQVKVISSAYSCKWSSATKTMFSSSNLIAKGLGTLEPLRLARPGSSDQSGGLVYKTSVDFTSNVHVYLRAEINPGTDSSSWAFDGIGINFAKTDYVYSGSGGGCIGYCGIQKALVTEFDFYHNQKCLTFGLRSMFANLSAPANSLFLNFALALSLSYSIK